MGRHLTRIACLVALTWSSTVGAQEQLPPPPPPEELPPPPPPADESPAKPAEPPTVQNASIFDAEPLEPPPPMTGRRTHDGFQLRAAIGLGGVSDAMSTELDLGALGVLQLDASASGGSFGTHLALGGEIAEGLTLGGLFLTETVTDPKIEVDLPAGTTQTIDTIEVGTFLMLAVYIDWYPNPKDGFHLGGGLGGGNIRTKDTAGNVTDADEEPSGGGLLLMIGYDFWVADELSLGILGRFVGASLSGEVIDHSLGAFSAMFALTYH